jgi:integrase
VKNSKKQKTWGIGDIRVRAIRGPHPDGRWYFRAERYEGTTTFPVWSGWATREEAERVLAKMILVGKDKGPSESRRGEEVSTVTDVLELWLGSVLARPLVKKTTVAATKASLRHLNRHLGTIPVDRLDLVTLDRYVEARFRESADKTTAGGTIDLELTKLRTAWTWARRRMYVPDRILEIPRVEIVGKPKYTPTSDEWSAILERLARLPWVHRLLLIQGCTGARLHEVVRMTWADVDLDTCTLRVPAGTKTGDRPVAIHESLRDYLAAVPESERVGRLIGDVTERTAMSRIYVYLQEACEAVGIPRIGTHALRRMVVDQYYRGGADVGTVAAQLGQSPETALKYYRRATHADRARAVALAGLEVPGAKPMGKLIVMPNRRTG